MPSIRELADAGATALRRAFAPHWNEPQVMVQLGAGFDATELVDRELQRVELNILPGMPDAPSPTGHALTLALGDCEGRQVLVAHGRRHFYEGHGPLPCVLPLCAAALAGVSRFVLVDAALGVRDEFNPGTWLLPIDIVNTFGVPALMGDATLGSTPFFDMNEAFSQELVSDIVNAGAGVGFTPRLGVYQATTGPHFPTPAEVAVAKRNGVDAIGHSLAFESIAARALAVHVAGATLIGAPAPAHGVRPPVFDMILDECRFCSPPLMRTLRLLIGGSAR